MIANVQPGQQPALTPEFLRKRKFLMMVPVLVLPFLTMAFWALGGGRNTTDRNDSHSGTKGLNTTLPQARFKNENNPDKMAIYQTAMKDSAAGIKGNVDKSFISAMGFTDQPNSSGIKAPADQLSQDMTSADASEAKIQAKLAAINNQLRQPETNVHTIGGYSPPARSNAEVKRLQLMMEAMQSDRGEDPEMKQLSRMLQQIGDIQNPGKAQSEKAGRSLKSRNRVYAVTADEDKNDEDGVSSFRYAANKGDQQAGAEGNTIQAVIHENQTLTSGAVVKLRLVDGIEVGGRKIPKGSFVYGTCALSNERLTIKISTIRYLRSIMPVTLSVYDLDGLEGIYVPGSIGRDAAKSGMNNAVSSMRLMTLDQSVGAQAAGAGIEAAKGLFGKKVKQIKVKVKAGYEVLLKDNNDRSN